MVAWSLHTGLEAIACIIQASQKDRRRQSDIASSVAYLQIHGLSYFSLAIVASFEGFVANEKTSMNEGNVYTKGI